MNNQEAIKQLKYRIATAEEITGSGGLDDMRLAVSALEREINGGWIKCSDRLPSKEECLSQNSNQFEVTKIINGKFRITDYCILHTDYVTWHIRDNDEVIAWRKKVEPFKEKGEVT